MSQLAFFHLIDAAKVPALMQFPAPVVKKKWFGKTEVIDDYPAFFEANATHLWGRGSEDNISGAIFANIYIYLQEKCGLDLEENECREATRQVTHNRGMSVAFLTRTIRDRFEELSHLKDLTLDQIRKINKEIAGFDDDETALDFKRGLSVLGDVLKHLEDDKKVVVFEVG